MPRISAGMCLNDYPYACRIRRVHPALFCLSVTGRLFSDRRFTESSSSNFSGCFSVWGMLQA
jgi:hypothetical protein